MTPLHIPLLLNKLRSIFDPERNMPFNERLPNGNEQFQGPPSQVPINPTGTSYNDNTQLDRTMEDKFNEMLSNFPQRPEHTSKIRQIGAIIAGMGSDNPMATADQFKNYHYYNALKDYTTQLPFFQQASDNERMINRDIINQQIQDRRLSETERYNRSRDENADLERKRKEVSDTARNEINRKRAETYAEIAKGGSLLMDETGRTYIVYKDGTKRDVDVDQFSNKELEEARARHAESLAHVRGSEQRKNISAQETKDKNVIQFRETIPYNPAAHRPTSTSSGGKTTNADLTAKAKTIRSQRPDLAPYIKMEKNTFKEISAPEERGGVPAYIGSFFGSSAKPVNHDSKIKEANKLMFGESTSSTGKWVKDANGIMIRK